LHGRWWRDELRGIDPENITYYFIQAGDGDPEQRSIQHGCLKKIPVCPDAPQRQSPAAYFEVPPTQVVEVGLEVEI
jgi:hypothetical protein